MDIEEIREIMADSDQCRIEYVDNEGNTHTGFVDVYETAYDNDEFDESSLCFAGDNGEMIIVWEHNIKSIRILKSGDLPVAYEGKEGKK